MSCGGGTKVLVRECNEPVPAHGGNDCDGVPYRVESCNTCPCEPGDWNIVTVYTPLVYVHHYYSNDSNACRLHNPD